CEAAEQGAPQLNPAGSEVTVPLLMMPVLLTVRVNVCRVKVAVTDLAALMLTVQVVPEAASQPLQPVNVDPVAGVAVRVTTVPLSKAAEQVAPQLIPAGSEVTVPLPVPALVTVRVLRARAVLLINTETLLELKLATAR